MGDEKLKLRGAEEAEVSGEYSKPEPESSNVASVSMVPEIPETEPKDRLVDDTNEDAIEDCRRVEMLDASLSTARMEEYRDRLEL